jgi:hypothetical protein
MLAGWRATSHETLSRDLPRSAAVQLQPGGARTVSLDVTRVLHGPDVSKRGSEGANCCTRGAASTTNAADSSSHDRSGFGRPLCDGIRAQ